MSDRTPRTDQLSLTEAGKHDWARKQAGTFRDTRWAVLSRDRAKRGVSRRLRIAQKASA